MYTKSPEISQGWNGQFQKNDLLPSLLGNHLVNHTGGSQADGPNSRIHPLNILFGLLILANSRRKTIF